MGKLKFLPQPTFEESILSRAVVILNIIKKNPNITLKDLRKKLGISHKKITKKKMEELARIILSK
jgi:predicted HTH transcriptional regulator